MHYTISCEIYILIFNATNEIYKIFSLKLYQLFGSNTYNTIDDYIILIIYLDIYIYIWSN